LDTILVSRQINPISGEAEAAAAALFRAHLSGIAEKADLIQFAEIATSSQAHATTV